MATTDISICNSALIMAGADDINSFNDNTVEAKLCRSTYADTRDGLMQYHPWRFSLKQADLGGELVTDPLFKWTYQYQTPQDLLRIIALEGDQDYEVYGDKIYTDAKPCRVVYQRVVPESDMPAYFVNCLKFHLAKIFALALQEDTGKMETFERVADKETARARSIDTQQQPNVSIPEKNFSLVNIRG